MEDRVPRLAVLEALVKLTAVASLFAYLLHRGGLKPVDSVTVTLAHLMAVSCVMPTSAELVFVTTVTLGTCSYAVLAVDRPWLRAGIVAACLLAFGAHLALESAMLTIIVISPLALWTGFMVIIRDWSRTRPASTRPSSGAVADDR